MDILSLNELNTSSICNTCKIITCQNCLKGRWRTTCPHCLQVRVIPSAPSLSSSSLAPPFSSAPPRQRHRQNNYYNVLIILGFICIFILTAIVTFFITMKIYYSDNELLLSPSENSSNN